MAYSQLFLSVFIASYLILSLNATYHGYPPRQAVLRGSAEFKCEYTGTEDSGEFDEWFKDDKPISAEKPGHYVVRQTKNQTILSIKIFVQEDADVKRWYVKTKKPSNEQPPKCTFGPITVVPSPQGILTDRESEKLDTTGASIRRNEDESATFRCLISPKTDQNEAKWTFSTDGKDFNEVPGGVINTDDGIKIEQVKKAHRGYYRCSLNDERFDVMLRVKDRFAALWPFIGIVSVVIVLVIVILIFEKRQKSNKKQVPADDDDQDQAQDLITRTTKGSDNEAKKRSVKA